MEMPFTEDELRAVREADAEIERIFEAEYFIYHQSGSNNSNITALS